MPFLPPYRVIFLLFLCLLATEPTRGEKVTLTARLNQEPAVSIRGVDSLDVIYLAVNDFAGAFLLAAVENADVRKFEFRLPSHRVKITRNNPFLVVTDLATNAASVYQLSLRCFLIDSLYYVPASEFLRLVDVLWPNEVSYDDVDLLITVRSSPTISPFDISNVLIEPKLNGYLMTLVATKKLGDVEAWLKPDGWLFVTVANATADTTAIAGIRPFGAIRRILTFQSPTSVQLTFKVAPDVVKAEILNDPDSHNLMISLHTQSAAEKAELEKRRQQWLKEKMEHRREKWKMDVIVIDAGHGGKDPGTIGVGGTREKDVTLGVALKLGRLLERNLKDVQIVYTRKDDRFIELYKRTEIANEAGGKLFVSIHCNSTERKPSKQNGFEIYLLRPGRTEDAIRIAQRENSVIEMEEGYKERYPQLTEEDFILVSMRQSAFMKYSEQFAQIAAESMAKHLNIRNSGVKQAGFYVLVGASMPNVLVETGYLSNRNEEKVLRTEKGQQKIAQALFEGIKEYKAAYEKALEEGEVTVGVNR